LFNGNLDDEGLRHLAGLSTLEELAIHSSGVSDAAVEHLVGLKALRKLNVSGTKITDAGKQRLRSALPNAEITP
jgi:hypothetical protein